MSDSELFIEVHQQLLDYADDELKISSAQWGLDVFNKLKYNKYILGSPDTDDHDSRFMYAITTSFIVGIFGNRTYNDKNFLTDAIEIDLEDYCLDIQAVRGYLDSSNTEDGSTILLSDIMDCVCEYKEQIFQVLKLLNHDKEDPILPIYESLVDIFNPSSVLFSQQQAGYQYVSEGFCY